MDKKTKIILAVVIGIFLLGVGIGLIASISDDSSQSNSPARLNPAVYTAAFLPMITIFIVYMQPTSPVNNVIYLLSYKKYGQDKRAKYIEPYITNDFKGSEWYNEMIKNSWPKYKKTEIKEKGKERSIVLAELANGDKYEFEVIKRTKENSVKQASLWVINSYTRV